MVLFSVRVDKQQLFATILLGVCVCVRLFYYQRDVSALSAFL